MHICSVDNTSKSKVSSENYFTLKYLSLIIKIIERMYNINAQIKR